MNEERLKELLRDAPVPGAAEAEERGLALLEETYAARPPRPRAAAPRFAIALAAAVLAAALALSPAGAEVREWIGDAVARDEGESVPAITSLPGGGRLLVTAPNGAWIVHEDGSRRLLGDYTEATWSPNGRYVGAARANALSAVEPDGDPRWSLSRPEPIAGVRWSPHPGYRIAYRAGDELRVVAGDGTGDSLLARRVAAVAPAWRPGPRHVLAYYTAAGAIRVVDTDSRRALFGATPPGPRPSSLEWSTDGARLLATFAGGARLYDRRGRAVATLSGRVAETAFRPGGHLQIAVLLRRPDRVRPTTEVILATPEAPGKRLGPLFSAPGALTGLAWSPDGERILVGWRDADAWLFVPRVAGKVRSVGGVSSLFAPGDPAPGGFPAIDGWCCAAAR